MMFVDCPAWLDQQGALRCGLPAEVRCRYVMRPTGGPLEAAMIRCPAGHWSNGPVESLTCQTSREPGQRRPADAATAARDSLAGSHDGPAAAARSRCRLRAARRSKTFPPGRRSRLLPGPARPPVDHRHAPAPRARRARPPGGNENRSGRRAAGARHG